MSSSSRSPRISFGSLSRSWILNDLGSSWPAGSTVAGADEHSRPSTGGTRPQVIESPIPWRTVRLAAPADAWRLRLEQPPEGLVERLETGRHTAHQARWPGLADIDLVEW